MAITSIYVLSITVVKKDRIINTNESASHNTKTSHNSDVLLHVLELCKHYKRINYQQKRISQLFFLLKSLKNYQLLLCIRVFTVLKIKNIYIYLEILVKRRHSICINKKKENHKFCSPYIFISISTTIVKTKMQVKLACKRYIKVDRFNFCTVDSLKIPKGVIKSRKAIQIRSCPLHVSFFWMLESGLTSYITILVS